MLLLLSLVLSSVLSLRIYGIKYININIIFIIIIIILIIINSSPFFSQCHKNFLSPFFLKHYEINNNTFLLFFNICYLKKQNDNTKKEKEKREGGHHPKKKFSKSFINFFNFLRKIQK